MSFSLSFVVAIASNVLVPIRSPLPCPCSIPFCCCYFLPTLWHQNLLRQATANAVPSRGLATPACLPDCLPVCVCACWHAADTVTFTVLPNVFGACLFVRPAVCPVPPLPPLSPSLCHSFVVLSVPFRALSFLLSAYCRRLLHASHFVCLATINV